MKGNFLVKNARSIRISIFAVLLLLSLVINASARTIAQDTVDSLNIAETARAASNDTVVATTYDSSFYNVTGDLEKVEAKLLKDTRPVLIWSTVSIILTVVAITLDLVVGKSRN